mmetsp:Transcript_31475/g.53104  ORF Transcript_31475/g.53104 Transcript_31475/m.53104 type:complete len:229 (-) Transcript_31475:589-1275(-)
MVEESAIVIVIVVTAVPLELLLVSIVHLLLLVLVLVIATLPGMCKLLLQPANQYILIIIVIIRAVTITMETVWVVAAALSFLLLLQMCPFDQPARCVVTVMQIYSSVSPTLSSTTLNSDNSSSSSSKSGNSSSNSSCKENQIGGANPASEVEGDPRPFFRVRPSDKRISYKELVLRNKTKNFGELVSNELEVYLTETEFEAVFMRSREAFYALPRWRRQKCKQQLQLF